MRVVIFLSVAFVALGSLAACGSPPPQVQGVAVTPTAPPAPQPSPESATPSASAVTTPTSAPPAPTDENSPPPSGASLNLSRYAARPGESLAVQGAGFAPGESVHLQFTGSPAVPAGDLEANAEGAISAQSIRVPALPEGQHSLVAVGEQSGRGGAAIISVLGFSPWVVLGAYAPRPGESFGFAGAGFAPGDSVDVYLDGSSSPMATVTTDDEGGVQVQTLLRASPGDVGKHNLEFVAKNTGLSLPVAFEVLAFVPTTELSPYAGPPGTTVTFSGKGFAPGESVRAYLDRDDGRQEVSAFEADPTGSFERAGSYVVPAGDTNLTLILEGEDSGVPVSQRFGVLPLSPWAGTSSYSGPPGTQISFRGKGFAAGENVHIYDGESGNADKLASAIADENGSFESALFVIPPGAPDVLTFRFVGERSGGAATTEFTVTAP